MRRALLLLSLLLSPVLLADTADLSVRIEAATQVGRGVPFPFRGIVTNDGPGIARNVVVTLQAFNRYDCQAATPIGDLAPGATRTFDCEVTVPATGELVSYQLELVLIAQTTSTDPAPNNNFVTVPVDILTPPDLRTVIAWSAMPTPGLPFPLTIRYINHARVAASSATITIDSSVPFASVPDFCTVTDRRAVCSLEAIAAAREGSFDIQLLAPDASRQKMTFAAKIETPDGDAAPSNDQARLELDTVRAFFVTTVADSGPGSLRDAIDRVNAECVEAGPGCQIAFRIPMGAQQWQTIAPATPLPFLFGQYVVIDGTTQTRWSGDTNPLGPEIELSGANLEAGHGIDHRGCATGFELRGLAINGFRWNGVQIGASPGRPGCSGGAQINNNYIGTDPTGTRAVPNGRGIVVDRENAGFIIEKNVISGNERSGVFIERGAGAVRENVIGLNATVTAALGNGASGVYVGPGGSGTDVNRNYIGFNHHFGIAVAAGAQYVEMSDNSLQANHQMGIDRGLDGNVAGPMPEITSVRVENGETIVEGISNHRPSVLRSFVYIYANDAPDPSGFGEGQYTLGSVELTGPVFRFVYPHDLRGKWVTATLTQRDYVGWLQSPRTNGSSQGFLSETSEFSRAVEVK